MQLKNTIHFPAVLVIVALQTVQSCKDVLISLFLNHLFLSIVRDKVCILRLATNQTMVCKLYRFVYKISDYVEHYYEFDGFGELNNSYLIYM